MLIVSPHLDDAVFSCGALLAACPGSCVITIFAGTPDDPSLATDWDRRCGFDTAGQAMEARRQEDAKALDMLGARPVWLGFCDSQYGRTPDLTEVAQALGRAIASHLARAAPSPVLLPLGLFHSDHELAHAAGARAVAGLPPRSSPAAGGRLLAYEDSPYRGMKGMLQRRLAQLGTAGILATPIAAPVEGSRRDDEAACLRAKRSAVAAYASQLRAFGEGGYEDAWRPERFWALENAADPRDG